MVPEKKLFGFKNYRQIGFQPWLTNPYGWNIVYLLALKQNNNLVKQNPLL
jgi:hypothetical protein